MKKQNNFLINFFIILTLVLAVGIIILMRQINSDDFASNQKNAVGNTQQNENSENQKNEIEENDDKPFYTTIEDKRKEILERAKQNAQSN